MEETMSQPKEPEQPEPTRVFWPTAGAELEADPSSIAGYGQNAAIIAKNFQQDITGPAMMLRGGGSDISISTGAYPEGSHCQSLLDRNAGEMLQFLQDGYQSCLSLASCALILGELLTTADTDGAALAAAVNAVKWGFAMDGGKRPEGLTPLIDGKTIESAVATSTVKDAIANPQGDTFISHHQTGDTWFYTFLTAAGTIRTVVQGPNGYTEIAYAKDGTTKLSETKGAGQRVDPSTGGFKATAGGDGIVTTVHYDERDGKTITGTTEQRIVTSTPSATPNFYNEQRITTEFDADGKVTSSNVQHITTTGYNNGLFSRDYYNEATNEKGEVTISGERAVTKQPQAVTPDDYATAADEMVKRSEKMLKDR
jgi:hypothetical protein